MDEPTATERAEVAADEAFRRRLARWLAGLAAAITLATLWTGVVATSEVASSGSAFPAFALVTLEGEPADGTLLEGHVTVVNFWASWCPPCRSEAPVLARVAEQTAPDGVRFLGVLHRDQVAPAREFAEQFGLDFPTVVDDGSLAGPLGVRAIPTTFVVGVDGTVLSRHFGPIREARLRVLVEDALARAAAAAGVAR
jgi:cytochrome c biogenesis protein CcmG, thiol:disulfide interchange protein DsbE